MAASKTGRNHINCHGEIDVCNAASDETCTAQPAAGMIQAHGSIKEVEEALAAQNGGTIQPVKKEIDGAKFDEFNYAELKGAERADKIVKDLENAIHKIIEDGDLKLYLDSAAKNGMRKWSFNNQILAGLQLVSWKINKGELPRDISAEQIMQEIDKMDACGAKQWNERGRKVSSGKGSALYILAPLIGKRDVVDSEGNVRRDEDGNPMKTSYTYGFRSVAVFDASQTEGKPIPKNPIKLKAIGGEVDEGRIKDMVTLMEKRGYTYSEKEIASDPEAFRGTLAYVDPTTMQVVVDPRLSSANKAAAIAHELAHIELGHVNDGIGDYRAHRGQKETEAEALSYMLMRDMGTEPEDAAAFSPGYIASWSGGDKSLIKKSLDRVSSNFGKIINDLGWGEKEV